MRYSFTIIYSKIKPGFWQSDVSEQLLFNKWTKLLARRNDDLIVSNQKELCLIDAKGNSLWEKSLTCPGIPNSACVSDDCLLVTSNSEDYHAWGVLGPAMLIDLTKGIIITGLRGSHGSALSNGRFLLGLEGYGVFNTWLYDSNGSMLQQWRSYGHYVVGDNDFIRVVEQDRRGPTNARVVKLKLDGSIEKGYKLKTCSASNPISLNNGDIIFENSGALIIVDLDLKEVCKLQLMNVTEENSWRFHSRLSLNQDILTVDILERLEEPSRGYQTHEWLIELIAHDTGYASGR